MKAKKESKYGEQTAYEIAIKNENNELAMLLKTFY